MIISDNSREGEIARPDNSAVYRKPLFYARNLASLGVPIFTCKVDDEGNPVRAYDWQKTEPGEDSVRAIDRWQPGWALGAVTGSVFDVVDVDPRNGGLESWPLLLARLADEPPELFGIAASPSRGGHFWIASQGVAKTKLAKGIDLQARGGFVFIAPTVRPSKWPADDGEPRPYTWVLPPDWNASPWLQEQSAAFAELPWALGGAEPNAKGTGRRPAQDLMDEVLSAEAGEQRNALLRLVREMEMCGLSREAITDTMRNFLPRVPSFDPDNKWYPARGGNPDKWIISLFSRRGRVKPDATKREMEGVKEAQPNVIAGEGEAVVLASIPDYPSSELTGPLSELVSKADNLPSALIGACGLGALAGLSGNASLVMPDGTEQHPALWIPFLASSGIGKSPALLAAFSRFDDLDSSQHESYREELADWKAQKKDDRGSRPKDPTLILDDFTMEGLVRFFSYGNGTGVARVDELSGFLSGIGRYNNSPASDVGRFLALWTCSRWRYTRVKDDIDILIRRPVLSIVGGIQPHLAHLLGSEDSGFRPRWLPHIVPPTEDADWADEPIISTKWENVICKLYSQRGNHRKWTMGTEAHAIWNEAKNRWKAEARSDTVTQPVRAALLKADQQCARISIALAESLRPGKGGDIPREAMRMAVVITDYVMNCWRSMSRSSPWTITRQDAIVRPAVELLRDWLERQNDIWVPSGKILRLGVGNVSTASDMRKLLAEYQAMYPGTVEEEKTGKPGRPAKMVRAPERR